MKSTDVDRYATAIVDQTGQSVADEANTGTSLEDTHTYHENINKAQPCQDITDSYPEPDAGEPDAQHLEILTAADVALMVSDLADLLADAAIQALAIADMLVQATEATDADSTATKH